MSLRPPRSSLTYTPFPYTTLFSSDPFSADDALISLGQLGLLHAKSAFLDGAEWIRPRAAELAKMSYVTPEMLQDLLDGPRGDNLSPKVRSAEIGRAHV